MPLMTAALLVAGATHLTRQDESGRGPAPEARGPIVIPASEAVPVDPADEGQPYLLRVALPLSYTDTTERSYPVVYFLDGDINFGFAGELARWRAITGELPEAIVVGIAYGYTFSEISADLPGALAMRAADLVPGRADPGAARFARVLTEEILPTVDARYRTMPDRTLVGYSHGGLFATYMLLHHPGAFGRYVIGSPSYAATDGTAGTWPETLSSAAAAAPTRVYTCVGTGESEAMVEGWRAFWGAVAEQAPAGWRVSAEELNYTHSAGLWIAAAKGLLAVFAPAADR